LEGEDTQYVWVTAQKTHSDPSLMTPNLFEIVEVLGADRAQGTIIAGGPDGVMSLIVRGLPDDVCDVTELTLQVGSSAAPIHAKPPRQPCSHTITVNNP